MQTSSALESRESSRTATARRLYFYVFSFVSLVAGLIAVDQLFEILSRAWLDNGGAHVVNSAEYMRNTIALNGGILLVATPLFLIHWSYIRRNMSDASERVASLRKLFLYLVSAVTAFYLLLRAYSLVRGLVDLALGTEPNPDLFPAAWIHLPLFLIVAVALHRYVFQILAGDGDFGQEQPLSGLWRRLYLTLAGLAGLLLLLFGMAQVLTLAGHALVALWAPVIGVNWWQRPVADGISRALLGFLLLRGNWNRWETLVTGNDAERASSLRRLYLYGSLLITGVTALVAVATMLRILLLIVFDVDQGAAVEVGDMLVEQSGLLIAGVGGWLWFRRRVRQELNRHAESPAGATVRRLYFYVMAALGLVLMWVGATDLVQALLSRFFGQGGGQTLWTSPLATGLSLLLVGGPVWVVHWRTMQQGLEADEQVAYDERRAWPRRFFLFAAILSGALVFLFQLARVVYIALLMLLGDPNVELFSLETTAMIAGALIAAFIWLAHGAVLRDDNRHVVALSHLEEEQETADRHTQRAAVINRISKLEAELADARRALQTLDESADDPHHGATPTPHV